MKNRIAIVAIAATIALTGLSYLSDLAGAASPLVASPRCASASLVAKRGPSDGAAGTIYYHLRLINTGAVRCSLHGSLSAQPVVGAAHTPVGPASRKIVLSGRGGVVTLAARHGVANALYGVVEAGNYSPTQCGAKNASGVVVTLGTTKYYVAMPVQQVCVKLASTTITGLAPGL